MPESLKTADVNKTEQLAGESRKTSSCERGAARPCTGHPRVISHVEGYQNVCVCVKNTLLAHP